ncbi:MAG: zinc ribbon domain-containing protein [Byssovorax sp.]
MSATAPGVSGAAQRCRACGADAPAGATRCPRCNAPLGKPTPCPHCGGEGGISADSELRFVCDLCGGPRVPHEQGQANGKEVPFLQKADAARKGRAAWRGTAIGSGVGLVLSIIPVLLLIGLLGPSLLLLVPGVLFNGLFALMLWVSLGRARQRGREIAPAIDAAWMAAANDLARSGALASPAELVTKLGLDEQKAEELSAMIDVDRAVGGVPGPKVRIATEPGAPLPPDPAFEALEKAAAEEEAAAEEAAGHAAQRKL